MRSNELCKSIVETIGDTPLVELSRLPGLNGGRILAKLEYLNPGFSKKDRIARAMIEEGEAGGQLRPGQTVVELTSGNTGTGLAIVCAARGYPFVAVMSRGNSVERRRMMQSLGAEVVLVDQAPASIPGQVSGADLALVEMETCKIIRERGAFRADQFQLDGNFNAHYYGTGPEIIRQCGGKLDAFCDFAGSGGSFGGIGAALKNWNPAIQCCLVEPATSRIYATGRVENPAHKIQGGGYSNNQLKYIDRVRIDHFFAVDDQSAIRTARQLARYEGIFAGFSSGANVAAALQYLQDIAPGSTVAVLCCDSGLKYLSTDLWD